MQQNLCRFLHILLLSDKGLKFTQKDLKMGCIKIMFSFEFGTKITLLRLETLKSFGKLEHLLIIFSLIYFIHTNVNRRDLDK